jgi:hypothetical protein
VKESDICISFRSLFSKNKFSTISKPTEMFIDDEQIRWNVAKYILCPYHTYLMFVYVASRKIRNIFANRPKVPKSQFCSFAVQHFTGERRNIHSIVECVVSEIIEKFLKSGPEATSINAVPLLGGDGNSGYEWIPLCILVYVARCNSAHFSINSRRPEALMSDVKDSSWWRASTKPGESVSAKRYRGRKN